MAACFENLGKAGWQVLRRGAPTAWITHPETGELAAVVAKPAPHRVLKGHQDMLLTLLHRAGVPIYYWTPQNGLKPCFPPEKAVK